MTTILSKLAPSVCELGRRSLQPAQILICSTRNGGHGHLFRKRQGQMYFNRVKDVIHFYYIGIGFLPMFCVLVGVHVVYGPCKLTDYPTEGPPPHFWQYERTPLRQWFAKWCGTSDMEYHERNLSLFERNATLQRWRRMEQRVKHLQGERWDYKGFFYQPFSATWIDYAKKKNQQAFWQYEEHGHNAS